MTYWILTELFDAGIGAYWNIPFNILLILITSIFLFRLGKCTKKPPLYLSLTIFTFFLAVFLQTYYFTSDSGKDPNTIIPLYLEISENYPDNIEFENLVYGNYIERIAAIAKYESNLPDKIYKLDFGNYGNYYFSITNGDTIYDRKKLLIRKDNLTTEFELLKAEKNFEIPNSTVSHGSGIKIDEENFLMVSVENFEIRPGIESIIYSRFKRKTTANSTYPKGGVLCSKHTFVVT